MTTASKITLIRVAMIPAFLIAFLLSPAHPWLKWLSLGLFILASLTDFVDGYVARKYNQISDFGKFLDPLADKLLVIAAMCVFCQWNLMPAWALIIVLTREFAVTGLRLIAVGKGRVIAAGWSGKVKTFSTMVALCIWIVFHEWTWLNWVIVLVIVLPTIYSGVEYFVKNWDVLDLEQKNR
ncbi:MAG: CDP-diacylglycerol--glycerol-3-phosphate 3-phosphatidyltransferase [Oscillospiraceae bacterium]|nr:CDP-diacylglycerol--glycerol-3-phosphate 3-phosphatidyltransferase [Oscillospiraceae bacterium]